MQIKGSSTNVKQNYITKQHTYIYINKRTNIRITHPLYCRHGLPIIDYNQWVFNQWIRRRKGPQKAPILPSSACLGHQSEIFSLMKQRRRFLPRPI